MYVCIFVIDMRKELKIPDMIELQRSWLLCNSSFFSNLTFTGCNSGLGMKSFIEKKKIISENSKATVLNKDVLSGETQDKEVIVSKVKTLAEILVKKCNYIKIDNKVEKHIEKHYNLNERIDYSGTKPREFSFIGEYIRVNSWKDLLGKFIILTFNMDNSIY